MMAVLRSKASLLLPLPPSCIAFNLTHPSLFVVGTYFLHPTAAPSEGEENKGASLQVDSAASFDSHTETEVEETGSDGVQKRTGSLILYELVDDDDGYRMYVRVQETET